MERSGNALRLQVTGAPEASSEGPAALGTHFPETDERLLPPGVHVPGRGQGRGCFTPQPSSFPSSHRG